MKNAQLQRQIYGSAQKWKMQNFNDKVVRRFATETLYFHFSALTSRRTREKEKEREMKDEQRARVNYSVDISQARGRVAQGSYPVGTSTDVFHEERYASHWVINYLASGVKPA